MTSPEPSSRTASASITLDDGTELTVRGVIFDKDGTLLDFHATWDETVGAMLDRLTVEDPTARAQAAEVLQYDLAERRVLPGSPIIAESNDHIIELLRPVVAHLVPGDLSERFTTLANEVGITMVKEEAGAETLLAALTRHGIAVGAATNDFEDVARKQFAHLSWTQYFTAVVGSDSGFGAKPEPGMVIGCAEMLGVDPSECLMVGDSPHDLLAARDAGAIPVLVGGNAAAVPFARLQIDGLGSLQTLLGLPA